MKATADWGVQFKVEDLEREKSANSYKYLAYTIRKEISCFEFRNQFKCPKSTVASTLMADMK